MVAEVPVKGVFEENCYFFIDDPTKHGFVIDPGAQGEGLLRLIRKEGWTIEKILLTHGHFDHTGAVDLLRKELGIPNEPVCFLRPATGDKRNSVLR